jgi:hypothetical protein
MIVIEFGSREAKKRRSEEAKWQSSKVAKVGDDTLGRLVQSGSKATFIVLAKSKSNLGMFFARHPSPRIECNLDILQSGREIN